MPIEVRALGAGDAALLARVADDVFDDPLDPAATRAFLADPRHHLVVALDAGLVVGFASAVRYVHPDKPRPELWINEVGVAPSHQRRGVGRAIVAELLALARREGCGAAWVLTEAGNVAARSLYAAAGGREPDETTVLYEFALDDAGEAR
jgi:aminoglycoside 6'-N-acetyltransferase I